MTDFLLWVCWTVSFVATVAAIRLAFKLRRELKEYRATLAELEKLIASRRSA
jgi:hypothetical protein